MARHSALFGLVCWGFAAVVLALPAGLRGQPPPAGAATVDEETADKYNDFCDQVSERFERAAAELTSRYGLDEDQQETVREMIAQSREAFLRQHGREAFDLFQRGRAVGQYMRQEKVGWQELPADIREDLVAGVLPLLDVFVKQATGLADALAQVLDDKQREQLSGDRRRMESQFQFARASLQAMSGRAPFPPGGRPGATTGQARTQPAGRAFAAQPTDEWERYVREFVRRHRLDEVQKLRALDLLKKYRALANEPLRRQAETQPATRPASQPTTRPAGGEALGGLRRRLAGLRKQRLLLRELFEQLKAELDKIPTAAQRQLAEEERRKSAAETRPAKG